MKRRITASLITPHSPDSQSLAAAGAEAWINRRSGPSRVGDS